MPSKAINRFDIVGYLLKPIDLDEFGMLRKIREKAGLLKDKPGENGDSFTTKSVLFHHLPAEIRGKRP
ncbi:MAG: hypothetical protein IPJ86_06245 [Bacteroidetes bacterium]|nr:hypothetical protein [Bacteroidota bacterium]